MACPGFLTVADINGDVGATREETNRAVYLIIDVGKMGSKHKRLLNERNAARANRQPLSDLEFVDGKIKPSASKR